ncbi:MAG: L,D-transpeptidase family protein [Clostridia bacterium]|nr:L,D-transpeptidase family protein [Clostridia bacterium]
MELENKIVVKVLNESNAILSFPKCHIHTCAFIGRNGATEHKVEGDLKTPIGEFDLGIAMGMHPETAFTNHLHVPYLAINENLYWVDDANSKYYNQLVDISNVEKDWQSAEHLIDYPKSYEYLIEIKCNPQNIPGKGSAVFLHAVDKGPTAGCVAVECEIMKKIIESVDGNTRILIF